MSRTSLFAPCLLCLGLSCCSSGPDGESGDSDTEDLTIGSGGIASAGGAGSGGQGGSYGSGGFDSHQASGGDAPNLSGGAMNDGPSGGLGGGDAGSGGSELGAGGNGAGGVESGESCPFSGMVHYQLNSSESWPADVVVLIETAMEEATYYYNCYADLNKSITVNYNPGVPTAEANVDGWLSFGADQGYMQVATAMHEIAHTLGVGYSPWVELMENGRWQGSHVDQLMTNIPAEERDPDSYAQRTYITGDNQHFWPYGLNQASEYQSEWSLINHVRIVAAIQLDKQEFLDGGS